MMSLIRSDMTRRQLGLVAVGSAVAVKTIAQTTPDWLAVAVESKRAAAAELAAFEIGMSVEPAFQFKA